MLIDPTEDSTPPLTATWNGADGQRSLRVSGELDIATAPQLATALEGELRPGYARHARSCRSHVHRRRGSSGAGGRRAEPVKYRWGHAATAELDGAARPGGRRSRRLRSVNDRNASMNATVLWVIAAILVIVGIVQLLQGEVILGVVLIIVGCLVGPGGVSLFRSRHT